MPLPDQVVGWSCHMLNKESPDGCLLPLFSFDFTWCSISNPSGAHFGAVRYEAYLWTRYPLRLRDI